MRVFKLLLLFVAMLLMMGSWYLHASSSDSELPGYFMLVFASLSSMWALASLMIAMPGRHGEAGEAQLRGAKQSDDRAVNIYLHVGSIVLDCRRDWRTPGQRDPSRRHGPSDVEDGDGAEEDSVEEEEKVSMIERFLSLFERPSDRERDEKKPVEE